MSYYIESLGLKTLEIDENNPRFPPTESQDEAIRQMLDYIPEKIIAIARDISKNGLNPLVTPAILTTEDGKNIVKDGNRRITAIKLMMDPNLTKNPELKRKFEKSERISIVLISNTYHVQHSTMKRKLIIG